MATLRFGMAREIAAQISFRLWDKGKCDSVNEINNVGKQEFKQKFESD